MMWKWDRKKFLRIKPRKVGGGRQAGIRVTEYADSACCMLAAVTNDGISQPWLYWLQICRLTPMPSLKMIGCEYSHLRGETFGSQ